VIPQARSRRHARDKLREKDPTLAHADQNPKLFRAKLRTQSVVQKGLMLNLRADVTCDAEIPLRLMLYISLSVSPSP